MRQRLTYSNVVATLALFLALGLGGAYAADKIRSKDIAKSAVTSKTIKNKTIKGKDVKDRAITAAKLAPIGARTPVTLGNGGEGDCIWTDATADFPGAEPVSYRRNGFGEVSFSGAAAPTDGPGGDAACTGAGPDAPSDSLIFTIPEADRPELSLVLPNPAGGGIIVVAGANGLNLGSTFFAPGSVLSAISSPAFLHEIEYVAADAAGPVPATGKPDRISPRALRQLGW
jgi:hypothetical protein